MATREDAERGEWMERSKIMLGRSPDQKKLWWRVTIYVGDSREDIETAMSEALRVDQAFATAARERGLA